MFFLLTGSLDTRFSPPDDKRYKNAMINHRIENASDKKGKNVFFSGASE